MRKEKWWWIAVAVIVSLVIHLIIGLKSRVLNVAFVPPTSGEMEVTLEPISNSRPAPTITPAKVAAAKIAAPRQVIHHNRVAKTVVAQRRSAPVEQAKVPNRPAKIAETRVDTPILTTGGVKIVALAKPLPTGLVSPAAKSSFARPTELTPTYKSPITISATRSSKTINTLTMDNPLAVPKSSEETPQLEKPSATMHIMRIARTDLSLSGGGAPSPSNVIGGRNGAIAKESPTDDLLFNGGGAGGLKVPKLAARIGGGGGNPILSVSNPLAAEAIPEDKPGIGAGIAGGEGLGAGGGAGFGRGRGVGTRLLATGILSSLRRKAGAGLGAGFGTGRGTRIAGGGTGIGSEMPGTGGAGLGYGHGNGTGVGNGFRSGIGSGTAAFSDGGASGGMRMASGRGIPFGDITGLLRGDTKGGAGTNGGPGGLERGAGAGGTSGGSAPLHVVYLLDVSGSMRYNDKIIKARAALAQALSELRRSDYFNIICFDKATYPFAGNLVKATPANVARATDYMNSMALDVHPGTDMSGVMEMALTLRHVSEIFLMSDGEPNGGIMDFNQLRSDVLGRNTYKVPIFTLALGVGKNWKGIDLMKGMAEDNHGTYHYIDLKGTPRERKPDHS